MSKIGYAPIHIPAGITVQDRVDVHTIEVVGPKGSIKVAYDHRITCKIADTTLTFDRTNETKTVKAMHGLYRSLVANAIIGVAQPWSKKLEIVGTGFQVQMKGNALHFKIGFSHPVIFEKPAGVDFVLDGQTKVSVIGIDRQLVGQVAHQIRLLRVPDVYKGKGIRYDGEVIKLKPGKKVQKAA